jgi:hypothetical protein
MTDLLLKPEDSGEIPAGPHFDPTNPGTHAWDCRCEVCPDPGPDTRNLTPYLATAPFPTTRRSPLETGEQPLYEPETIGVVDGPRPEPAAVLALVGYTSTVDGELVPDATYPPTTGEPAPYPKPNPAPPPPGSVYVGRHRKTIRWRLARLRARIGGAR